MRLTYSALLAVPLVFRAQCQAQAAGCASLAGGCDGGKVGQTALQKAISAFQADLAYGGGLDTVVFSSASLDGVLAQVSYSCRDGSVPPQLTGDVIQRLLVQ